MADKKILDKLGKLMAHEESAREIGSVEEAAAFGRKIQALLDAYNLSLDEVELHAAKSSEIGVSAVWNYPVKDFPEWMVSLIAGLASLNGCRGGMADNGYVLVIGRKEDRKYVISMFRYFVDVCKEFSAAYETIQKEGMSNPLESSVTVTAGTSTYWTLTSAFGNSYPYPTIEQRVSSYRFGMVRSILDHMEASQKASMDEMAATVPEGDQNASLVFLRSRTDRVTEWIEDKLPESRSHQHSTPTLDDSSYLDGVRDGRTLAKTDRSLGE